MNGSARAGWPVSPASSSHHDRRQSRVTVAVAPRPVCLAGYGTQPASDGAGFGQTDLELLRQAEFQPGAASGQGLRHFVMHPVIIRQGCGRDESGGAIAQHCDKKPEPGHAGNARLEHHAHLVCHEDGQIPVDRVTFRQGGAAFGAGDVFARIGPTRDLSLRQPVLTQAQAQDQRTMHQQIGIAADRAGEMRVTGQSQAKMTYIFNTV